MASYADVTFDVIADESDGELLVDDSEGESGIVETKIPYADVAIVQATGRGNEHLTLKIMLESDPDYFLLKSYRGDAIARPLNDVFMVGITYPQALLTKIKGRRVTYAERWYADLEFTLVSP